MEMNIEANAKMTNSVRQMKFNGIKKTAEFKYSHQIVLFIVFFFFNVFIIKYHMSIHSACGVRIEIEMQLIKSELFRKKKLIIYTINEIQSMNTNLFEAFLRIGIHFPKHAS